MKFFQVLLTYGSLSTGFVCLSFIFCLSSVIFSFTLANTFSFCGLKFEVVYLVLSVHVSRVVISINALDRFIGQGYLQLGPFVRSFLNLLFLFSCNYVFMPRILRERISTVTLISIETERYILININGIGSFFVI